MVGARFGCVSIKCVLKCQWMHSSSGLISVVAWGVAWYTNRNLANLVFSGIVVPIFFVVCLITYTTHSAAPLEVGWYGNVQIFLIPFCLQNVLKSVATNWDPLSLIITTGNPKLWFHFLTNSLLRPSFHHVMISLDNSGSFAVTDAISAAVTGKVSANDTQNTSLASS